MRDPVEHVCVQMRVTECSHSTSCFLLAWSIRFSCFSHLSDVNFLSRQANGNTGIVVHKHTNLQLCRVRAAIQAVFLRKQQVATRVPGVFPTLILSTQLSLLTEEARRGFCAHVYVCVAKGQINIPVNWPASAAHRRNFASAIFFKTPKNT